MWSTLLQNLQVSSNKRILVVPILIVFAVGCAQRIEFVHDATDQPPETAAMFDWSEIGGVYQIQRIDAGQFDTILGLDDYCKQDVQDAIEGSGTTSYGRIRLEAGEYEYFYDGHRYRGSQRFRAEAGHTYVVMEEKKQHWRDKTCGWTTKIWVVDQATEQNVSTINTHCAPPYGHPPSAKCKSYFQEAWAKKEAARHESRAKQGDRAMAFVLATEYQNPNYIRPLAEQGDTEAAIVLAQHYGELGPLQRLAEQGDAEAAYEMWLQHNDAERLGVAWFWLCKAANARNARALGEIGYWHRSTVWMDFKDHQLRHEERFGTDPRKLLEEHGIRSDDVRAYMWYTLAAEYDRRYLQHRENIFAGRLSGNEIAQAEQMVTDWQQGDCPGAERRFPTD